VSRVAATAHDRLVPFFSAIVAVLAALGTLFSHHRSIQALALRNQALLLTAKATNQYQYYQTQQLKVTLYKAMLSEIALADTADRNKLRSDAANEQKSSEGVYLKADSLEKEAEKDDDGAVGLLRSFETLEVATTLFEISIAFASIAALTRARLMLWVALTLTSVGLVVGIVGYLQAH
jgi:hypothetical protein